MFPPDVPEPLIVPLKLIWTQSVNVPPGTVRATPTAATFPIMAEYGAAAAAAVQLVPTEKEAGKLISAMPLVVLAKLPDKSMKFVDVVGAAATPFVVCVLVWVSTPFAKAVF